MPIQAAGALHMFTAVCYILWLPAKKVSLVHNAAAPALTIDLQQLPDTIPHLVNVLQNIADRQKLLKQTQDEGTAAVHSYWRKGLKGRSVCISNGLLWNIEAPSGLLPFSCLPRPFKIVYCYFDMRTTKIKAYDNSFGVTCLVKCLAASHSLVFRTPPMCPISPAH